MNGLEVWSEYYLFLVPLIMLHITMAIIALINIIKHPKYRFGNKMMWIIVVVFIQIFGSAIYFIFGRGEEE